MPPLSPGEDLATAAGTTSPPLTWQDVDHRRGCGGDASINAGAVVDNNYKDNGGNGDDIDGGDSGRGLVLALALALALAQPTRSWTRYTREEFVIAMMQKTRRREVEPEHGRAAPGGREIKDRQYCS